MEIIKNILPWAQIILSILLIVIIMLQQKSSGGLGGLLGGGSGGGGSYHTRRGLEQTLFRATIIIGILFVLSAFLALLIQ